MEDNIWNRRNDRIHENRSHYNLYNHSQNPEWCLSRESNATNDTHFGPFVHPSSSLPFSLSDHHHNRQNDSFVAESCFMAMDAKGSQSLYFAAGTDPFPSSRQSSDSLSLKLGKRLYYEGSNSGCSDVKPFSVELAGLPDFGSLARGGKGLLVPGKYQQSVPLLMSSPTVAAGSAVPRCQVEGCNMSLMGSKEYHKRHKVCEMHSKAPKVIVQGIEQRFCQQCSRFHVISEFDDSKRSCRRRLAGHNERRRKNSSESASKNHLQGGRFLLASGTSASSTSGCALSLLSSETSPPWTTVSQPDLSLRSQAALRELIAENRAAALAKHFVLPDADSVLHLPVTSPRPSSNPHVHYPEQVIQAQPLQACFHPGSRLLAFDSIPAETLDLMRASHLHLTPETHLLSSSSSTRNGRSSGRTDDDDEQCDI